MPSTGTAHALNYRVCHCLDEGGSLYGGGQIALHRMELAIMTDKKTTFRLPVALHAQFVAALKAQDQTASRVIRAAVRAFIAAAGSAK